MERLVEDAREHVAGPHAAARQAQDGVELPTGLVHPDRELLDQVVVLVVAHVQVLAVFLTSDLLLIAVTPVFGPRVIFITTGRVPHHDGVVTVRWSR